MSFEKQYPNRKDHRAPYTFRDGSQRFDKSCRPGGCCPYCKSGRHHAQHRDEADADAQIEDFHNREAIEADEQAQLEWDQMWDDMEAQDQDELRAWEDWQYGKSWDDEDRVDYYDDWTFRCNMENDLDILDPLDDELGDNHDSG